MIDTYHADVPIRHNNTDETPKNTYIYITNNTIAIVCGSTVQYKLQKEKEGGEQKNKKQKQDKNTVLRFAGFAHLVQHPVETLESHLVDRLHQVLSDLRITRM